MGRINFETIKALMAKGVVNMLDKDDKRHLAVGFYKSKHEEILVTRCNGELYQHTEGHIRNWYFTKEESSNHVEEITAYATKGGDILFVAVDSEAAKEYITQGHVEVPWLRQGIKP